MADSDHQSKTTPIASIVENAVTSRRAVRRFLPREVARETIEEILTLASRAPSAVNTQPWRVYVLAGDARERLSNAVVAAYDAGDAKPEHQAEWFRPYLQRQRSFGTQFYAPHYTQLLVAVCAAESRLRSMT